MKYIKKICSYVFYTFLALLASLCIYTFISIDILGKDYANVFGYTYFTVASGSMSGTIEVNNLIIVKINSSYEPNDIITFKDSSGEFVTHRFIKKVNDKLITKGDVNNTEDDPISSKQVVGKVTSIIAPSFIFKFLAIVVIVIILLILFNFDKFFEKILKKESKKELENRKVEIKPNEEVSTKKINSIPVTGDTIKIPIGEIINLQKNKKDDIELLETDEISYEIEKKHAKEEELLRQTVKLLKIKNDKLINSKINKAWLIKYRYIYKIGCILCVEDNVELDSLIKKTNFKELYDYDMDEAGLYENLLNKIYDMPIYVFLQILVFSILYNDLEFFDGIYKMLKYKIQVDKQGEFTRIGKNDSLNNQKINELLEFMVKISTKFDTKNVLQLEKINEFVKLKKYIND